MLGYDEVHVHNMSFSQSKLHSIKTPIDFTFPDIVKTKYRHNHDENEHPFGFSPPLWSKNARFSYACPSSPMIAMAKGRKELMEMTNDLPESCYELSLKDIVVKDSDNFGLTMEERVDTKPKMKGKKKGTKKGPISRSVSLDTGVFLLKMFTPMSSFGSKKHRASRSKSMDGSKKHLVDHMKRYWKTWLFVENSDTVSSGSSNNNKYCTATAKKRFAKGRLNHGCIFF